VHQHGPVDAVLLALHGAMVSECSDDADGALVAAIRTAVGSCTVIGCTLDLHANVSDRLADSANFLIPYTSYPHVDMRERGVELSAFVAQALADRRSWRSYVFRNRQLDGCDQGRSSGTVMPNLLADAAAASEAGVTRVGICAGFPWADVPHAGPAVVISSICGRESAARVAAPLLSTMWDTRAETSLIARDCASACADAADLAVRGRRVLIADFSDNPGGGGYGTTTALLSALLETEGPPAVFAPLCDSRAARVCAEAGVGAEISLSVGGDPNVTCSGPPLKVTGRIIRCSETTFRAVGPMWTNREMRLGMTALLACGTVDIVITSSALQVTEPTYMSAAGVDIDRKWIIAIKSLQHFRAAFEPIVDDILFADSGGLVSSAYQRFPYERVRRPIWPLDLEAPRQ
jgi:microcystin degradation protein MlrC